LKHIDSFAVDSKGACIAVMLSFILVVSIASPSYAQEDNSNLAKKVQNPIANLISVPFQNNTNFGIGEFNRTQNILNIQPVVPSSLGNWTLINRTIVPIISQPDVTQPTGNEFGLGDITYEGFFTPSSKTNVEWGVGPVVILPTATSEPLGQGKWSAGPGAIISVSAGKFVLGAVAYNVWSFAGDSQRANVNQGFVQYFINYNLANAWYLTSVPAITVNWEATEGNQWVVPFGGGVGKVFAIGKQKINGSVQAFYNVIKPETLDGPDWTLRLQLALLFPQ